jgi:hypothetical protein
MFQSCSSDTGDMHVAELTDSRLLVRGLDWELKLKILYGGGCGFGLCALNAV